MISPMTAADAVVRNTIAGKQIDNMPRGRHLWQAATWLRDQAYALHKITGINPLETRPGHGAPARDVRGHQLAHEWMLTDPTMPLEMAASVIGCCDTCSQHMLRGVAGICAAMALEDADEDTNEALAVWETAISAHLQISAAHGQTLAAVSRHTPTDEELHAAMRM